jgi:hypothetical protein
LPEACSRNTIAWARRPAATNSTVALWYLSVIYLLSSKNLGRFLAETAKK